MEDLPVVKKCSPVHSNVTLPTSRWRSSPWRRRLHDVIFEADTRAGKVFDVMLIVSIIFSVVAVSLESVHEINLQYGAYLRAVEWTFTFLFTIEYILRLICVERPLRYARSFYGLVDLLAILPTYLSLILPGALACDTDRCQQHTESPVLHFDLRPHHHRTGQAV